MASPVPLQQNATTPKPFAWSANSTKAATLIADDLLTDEQIADEIGVNRSTLHRWKQHPDFSTKVDELTTTLQDRARRSGLARIDVRMRRYERRAKALDIIVEERAEAMTDVPGGRSGFMVRQYKNIGTGEFSREVEEYHFDAALAREMRELEKQVAQDTGQWMEKRELSGPDGGPLPITTIKVALDPDLAGES